MRIRDFITHPPYQAMLAQTRHAFTLTPNELHASWSQRLRPLPANVTVVDTVPDPSKFDVVIAATRDQYKRIEGWVDPRRIIFLSHTILHPWDYEFFAQLPPGVALVYVSDHKRATFGELATRGRTIRLAADTDQFGGYCGDTAAVLNVTNCYAQQADRGYALFKRLTDGLASQVIGHGNEDIAGARPADDFEHLQQIYQQHRCFLNTDPQGRMHLSTLEAMATGLPLVTLPIPELAPYLQHGVNAFVSDDETVLRESLEALLSDHELAHSVGAAGRSVVQEHFGIQRFLREWNDLFAERVRDATRRPHLMSSGDSDSPPSVAINAMSVGGEMTGIGHYTRNLVNALATTDARQRYLLLTGGRAAPRDSRFSDWNVDAPGAMWEQFELPELLAERSVDLYHNPAFGLPVVKTSRYVATVHDCIPRLFPQYAPAWLQEFFRHWAPTWMRLADHIICVSKHTKHDIMHLYGVDPDRVSVVHQCADPTYRPVIDVGRLAEVRARYGNRPAVCAFGRPRGVAQKRGGTDAGVCAADRDVWRRCPAGLRRSAR